MVFLKNLLCLIVPNGLLYRIRLCMILGNCEAANYGRVVVGKLQVWPWSIIFHVLAWCQKGGSRNCQFWIQKERQGTRHSCRQSWSGRCTIFFYMLDFLVGCRGTATWLLRLGHTTRLSRHSKCLYSGLTPEICPPRKKKKKSKSGSLIPVFGLLTVHQSYSLTKSLHINMQKHQENQVSCLSFHTSSVLS